MDYEDCKKYGSGGWIKGAVKHPGALTASAKKAKMGVQEFAHKHEHDSGKTGQRARLAITFSKMKHADGGKVETPPPPVDDDEEPVVIGGNIRNPKNPWNK